MYSPPFVPPLYFVKRGKYMIFNRLLPLFASAERGLGGEYVK
jgi:hypothetical protein